MLCSLPHWPPGVPLPPKDWQERLRDLAQVKNLLNGDTCRIDEGAPTAHRLLEFLTDPHVSELWERFNHGRPRL